MPSLLCVSLYAPAVQVPCFPSQLASSYFLFLLAEEFSSSLLQVSIQIFGAWWLNFCIVTCLPITTRLLIHIGSDSALYHHTTFIPYCHVEASGLQITHRCWSTRCPIYLLFQLQKSTSTLRHRNLQSSLSLSANKPLPDPCSLRSLGLL